MPPLDSWTSWPALCVDRGGAVLDALAGDAGRAAAPLRWNLVIHSGVVRSHAVVTGPTRRWRVCEQAAALLGGAVAAQAGWVRRCLAFVLPSHWGGGCGM